MINLSLCTVRVLHPSSHNNGVVVSRVHSLSCSFSTANETQAIPDLIPYLLRIMDQATKGHAEMVRRCSLVGLRFTRAELKKYSDAYRLVRKVDISLDE